MNTDHRNAALRRVQSALALFEHPIRKHAFGDVEGVDILTIALDRMTEALASLTNHSRTSETTLEDVWTSMMPNGLLDPATTICLRNVREGIKRATYLGVSAREISELDAARADLHSYLKVLIATRVGPGRDA